jgi:hypothetical protein
MVSGMDAQRAAMATLALDRAAIEAFAALKAADVPSILLKGRSFNEWLYGPAESRFYTDVDLLVPVDRWDQARATLSDLGYAPAFAARHDPPHAAVHTRPSDSMHIDLHRTLQGLTAAPMQVWLKLSQHTETLRLGGTDVTALDEVGRCVSVAVHAGRPDVTGERARDDLERAVARTDEAVWSRARDLAGHIGGGTAFATGLASTPVSVALAARLAVPAVAPPKAGLKGANALARALDAPSPGAAVRELLPWLVPTPALVRQIRPAARRGSVRLALAYVSWPLWLVGQAARVLWARRTPR